MKRLLQRRMLCPNCLNSVEFMEKFEDRRNGFTRNYLTCPTCEGEVPRMYAEDYRKFPPAVASAVGFSQHGKTVYFSALFYQLRHMGLAECWPRFFTQCVNDESLSKVWRGVERLNQGHLPAMTPKVFPQPIMLRIGGFPGIPNRTLIMYDAAGESFERPSQLIRHAHFVRGASTVLFFVSLLRIREASGTPDHVLRELLETYITGVRELKTKPRNQNLKIVFTMADSLDGVFGDAWEPLRKSLTEAHVGDEATFRYQSNVRMLSNRLEQLTRERLRAFDFLNLAHSFFRTVSFCMVSALGTAPEADNTIVTRLVPRRVLDPILDVLRQPPAKGLSSGPRPRAGLARFFS